MVAGQGLRYLRVAGPFLETEAPKPEAWLRTKVNGQVRQEAQILDMIRAPTPSSPSSARR